MSWFCRANKSLSFPELNYIDKNLSVVQQCHAVADFPERVRQPIITARKRSLREGYVFTGVCDSVNGGRAWFYSGGMHGFIRGVYMVLFGGACVVLSGGGHAWFNPGGVHGLIRGGMRGFIWGVRGFIWEGMRGFSSFFGYNEIRSMSGRYASY